MKKRILSWLPVLVALAFTFVACDNGTQAVEVKNWSDQYSVTVPAFSIQPTYGASAFQFSLTGASGSAIGSGGVPFVCKVEGKSGFFYSSTAPSNNVSYNYATDAYDIYGNAPGALSSLPNGSHTIRVGIQYSTSSSVYNYAWSDTFEVTK
jgi:hypothetical protein